MNATKRRAPGEIVAALRALGDCLRSGCSLRQAIERVGGPGSPFAPLAAALASGAPLVPVLRAASGVADPDLKAAFCVLGVHAQAGGDPIPAVAALADRLGRRATARAEAKALTTQARLGTRAMLALTPAFGVLLLATDPRATLASFSDPRTRAAVAIGVVLQILGGCWIATIVRTATGEATRFAHMPFVRALRAVFAGRWQPDLSSEVADASELIALALDAGLSPAAGVAAVAPYVDGSVGDSLRSATKDRTSPAATAMARALEPLMGLGAERLSAAYSASASLGVPLAPALRSLADELRQEASIRLTENVRRASVRALVPLGVVVLPAFVLACLVPLFIGGVSGLAS